MEEEFKLRGKTIRVARLLKGVTATRLSELSMINNPNYLAEMEQETKGITRRNHYRLLRALRRDLKYTDEELAGISLLVEHITELED
ncbi:hypothetical protein [Halobacillus sp. Cin3]|uniref:hypothetical protein n=1 Tax=Halobacillus sp. Cin3 TaxID=2928441 RepID=UPI00248E89B4|nr:hypothetical protein [Halobacillus sp. Cin3]